MLSTTKFPESLLNWLAGPKVLNGNITSFGMEYLFKGYRFSKPYDLPVFIRFTFKEYTYTVSFIVGSRQEHYLPEKNYDQLTADDEINDIVKEVTKRILAIIKIM
jgi:hypothetical protein